MKARLVLALCAALAVGAVASTAFADHPADGSCSGGLVQPGTYRYYTVTGQCDFAGGNVTITKNLTVAPGAALNPHAESFAVVHVEGNVKVGKGGILGLGAYGPPDIQQTGTVVDGNIEAHQPQSLYLSAITIHGNLSSDGGSGPGLNFPIKNVIVDGNVELHFWSGLWIGLFRSTIGGNVIFSNNTGTQLGPTGEPDSSEVADNVIGGNLICQRNEPAAQFGDSGGGPNTVGGKVVGQCVPLVK